MGNGGVALPPLAEGVMEEVEPGTGYTGYHDGGAFGLPVTSDNQEAALFLQFIAQEDVQAESAVAAPRITHTSTQDDPDVQAMNEEPGGYYDMLRDQGYLFAGAPAYPFHAQLREATAPIFCQILTGDIAPEEGLDMMAAQAEEHGGGLHPPDGRAAHRRRSADAHRRRAGLPADRGLRFMEPLGLAIWISNAIALALAILHRTERIAP